MSVYPTFYRRIGFGVAQNVNAYMRVKSYSRRALGGCKEATIEAIGDPASLSQLIEFAGYGVDIFNDAGERVWWGRVTKPEIDGAAGKAEITCKGWWSTLNNRYYQNSTGLLGYTDTSGDRQNIGEGSGIVSTAQSFSATLGSWTATSLGLWLYKVATTTDMVSVEIRNDNAGLPTGSVITSFTVDHSEITEGTNYIERVLPVGVTVGSTLLWIRVSRTGGSDPGSFYQVGVNRAAGFPGGQLMFEQPGGTWIVGSNIGGIFSPADMNFKLIGFTETTQQVASALTGYGEFITGVDIVDASGISTIAYRDGDTRLMKVVEDLLLIGTATSRRLLAEVTRERRVRVFAEPDSAFPHVLVGAVRYGVDLEEMANTISVAYTTLSGDGSTSGQRATTSWVSDAESASEYGTSQLRYSASNLDTSTAESLANTLLGMRRNPPAQIALSDAVVAQVFGPYNNPIRKDTCPAGVWMRVRDVTGSVPPAFVDASLVFVEEASYDAENDRYTPVPRGAGDPLEIVRVRNR